MIKHAVFILSALVLAGCATAPNYYNKPAAEVEQAVTIEDTKFDSAVKFYGPVMRTYTDGLKSDFHSYILRSSVPRGESPSRYQLYIEIIYTGDWRYYQSVSFEGGHTEDVSVINREVLGCSGACSFRETLGVMLDKERVLGSLDADLHLRFNAKSGDYSYITVPANYLKGFHAAVSNYNG